MSSQVPILVSSPQDIARPITNFVPYIWGDQFLNYVPENSVKVHFRLYILCASLIISFDYHYFLHRKSTLYIWGDQFLNYVPENSEKHIITENEHGKLKEEVRNMFLGITNGSFHKLKIIDDIQRLGVAYHFQKEIKEALENIYATHLDRCLDKNFIDLNYISLCFRLLRQQGIKISCDVFNKFKDENGMLKESLANEVEGLLSLYEAAYLGVRGETVLDEAILFSTTHLEAFLKQGNSILSDMVSRALYRPLRKSLVRVNAAHFISIYKVLPSYNETLLRFAILDFNLVQSMHKKELCDLTRWWRNVEFGKKFPYARDRMVECFFWSTGVAFEPKFYFLRKIIAKLIYLLTMVDDTYDSYGTMEELSLFTQRTKRWGLESTDGLPKYMKILYEILLDFFDEIDECMIKQGTSYRTFYTKEEMTIEIQSYFEEAKWRNEKIIPTVDEYLYVSTTSSSYAVISKTCLVCMSDDAVMEEDLQWLSSQPRFLQATELICRLMDDIVSNKRERETGNTVTSIECYIRQYRTTEEEAVEIINSMVSDAWKDLNQELLEPTCIKMDLLLPILHLSQVMDELYKDDDSYTSMGNAVREGISALFINPISLPN